MTPRLAARSAACDCALALALAVSACASEQIQPGAPREVAEKKINPFEVHEECLTLIPGDWLVYRFTAQRPVDFNIHYQEGNSVIMPLLRDKATEDDDTFRPLVARDYCLTWQAGREGAIIDYRILLNRSQR
jgi:hypothetical protein